MELFSKTPIPALLTLNSIHWYKGWQTADKYLSGNVRKKLIASAEQCLEFSINVEKLEQVQPRDLTAAKIDVHMGALWEKPEYYRQFLLILLKTPWNLQEKKWTYSATKPEPPQEEKSKRKEAGYNLPPGNYTGCNAVHIPKHRSVLRQPVTYLNFTLPPVATGRRGYPEEAMVCAFIVMKCEGVSHFTDLEDYLGNNPPRTVLWVFILRPTSMTRGVIGSTGAAKTMCWWTVSPVCLFTN